MVKNSCHKTSSLKQLTPLVASAGNFSPAKDPFDLPLEDFNNNVTINIRSAFVAAQQAVAGFAQLPDSASRTFIYTGNVLNVAMLPQFLTAGIGKSGAAHMIWNASAAYKERGYKQVPPPSITQCNTWLTKFKVLLCWWAQARGWTNLSCQWRCAWGDVLEAEPGQGAGRVAADFCQGRGI